MTPAQGHLNFGMIMTGHLTALTWARDMAKGQRRDWKALQMRSTDVERSRVMVSFDPNPAPPRLQTGDPRQFILTQARFCVQIIKTVTQTDNRLRI